MLAAETAPVKAKKGKATALEEDDEGEFATVGKGGKAMQFTPDGIFKNLQMVQEARGKKVGDIVFYITSLLTIIYLLLEHRPCRTNPYP